MPSATIWQYSARALVLRETEPCRTCSRVRMHFSSAWRESAWMCVASWVRWRRVAARDSSRTAMLSFCLWIRAGRSSPSECASGAEMRASVTRSSSAVFHISFAMGLTLSWRRCQSCSSSYLTYTDM